MIAAPVKAAVMFLGVEGSGLRGRWALEEGGPNVVLMPKAAVVSWLVSAQFFNEGNEKEDRDQEVKGGCVVGEMWEEQDREDG